MARRIIRSSRDDDDDDDDDDDAIRHDGSDEKRWCTEESMERECKRKRKRKSGRQKDSDYVEDENEIERNLDNLRRTLYSIIMSTVDFEESGHNLLQITFKPGQEMEFCIILLDCCCHERTRTYHSYYGLLGQRLSMTNEVHKNNFENCFRQEYFMIHQFDTNKLHIMAMFFAHLLSTDALSWHVLGCIRLREEDTKVSSLLFLKILFRELSEQLGIRLLNNRFQYPNMQEYFESIFPKDNTKNMKFSINFFTSIGLGRIVENMLQNYEDHVAEVEMVYQ